MEPSSESQSSRSIIVTLNKTRPIDKVAEDLRNLGAGDIKPTPGTRSFLPDFIFAHWDGDLDEVIRLEGVENAEIDSQVHHPN